MDVETPGTGSLTVKLIARISPKAAETTYTVTFHRNDGSDPDVYETKTVTSGPVAKPTTDPTRSGYKFDGWYDAATGGNEWNFSTNITSDKELYAHWTAQHTITFDPNKPGTAASSSIVTNMPASMTVAEGDQPVPAYPTKDPKLLGYRFLGWGLDEKDSTGTWTNATTGVPTMGTENLTYYAIWEANKVTLDAMIFGAKQGETPKLDAIAGGNSMARATDHTDLVNHFEYKFGESETGPWTDSLTWQGVTFEYENGAIKVTNKLSSAVGKNFWVKATSLLNGEVDTATVTLQVPPRINGGGMSGDLLPGAIVNVEKLTLTGEKEIPGDVTWNDIAKVEWYLGYDATMVGSTNTSEQGPEMKKKINDATATKNSVTIPTDAKEGIHLWMKVTGDDVDVDAGVAQGGNDADKAIWVDMGSVGKERRQIQVVPSAWNGGTKVPTLPDGIKGSATPLRLGEGENGQLSTISENTEYEFVGWNLTDSNTGYFVDSKTSTTDGKWTVTGEGLALPNGRNSATITIADLPTSGPIKVFAIYKKVQTYTITVNGDANIEKVKGTFGTTAKEGTTLTLTVKATDTVTLSAIPKKNCKNSGITFNPQGSSYYDQIASDMTSTVTLKAKTDITVTFTAVPLADLHVTSEQNKASDTVGYTPAVVHTVTLTNPGAYAATIVDPSATSTKLYTQKGGPTESTDFTITARPSSGTIAAGTTAAASAPKFEITPVAGLTPDTYTAWLHIKETTLNDRTKSGTQLDQWYKITFVVTEKDTFNGKVTVNVDGTGAGSPYKVRLGDDATTETTPSSGVVTYSDLKANTSYSVKVSSDNGATWADSGKVISVGAKEATVDYYTLTLAPGTGAVNVGFAADPTATSASRVVLAGTAVAVYATPAVGYNPNKVTWTLNNSTSKVTGSVVEVKSTVTATASYEAGNGVKYMWNKSDTTSVYGTDNTYYASTDKVTLPAQPTRAGYTFQGWAGASAGPVISGSDTATSLAMSAIKTAAGTADATGHYVLYAQWSKVGAVWANPDTDDDGKGNLPDGVYGGDYSASAAVTNGAKTGAVTYAVSKDTGETGLPDGLAFSTATGAITGKPKETGDFTFTVTATSQTDASLQWTEKYTLTVSRATPTITAISFAGVEEGVGKGDVDVYATVTAPFWDTSKSGTDKWVDKQYTYSATATPSPNPGTLEVTRPDTLNFGGNTTLNGKVTFTPSKSTATGYTGTTQTAQKFWDIYASKVEDCVFTLAGKTYGITVDPPSKSASIDVDGSVPTGDWGSFTVTNKGNQAAVVTYALDTAGTPDNFTLTATNTTIAVGGTDTFTVALKDISNATPGIYTTNVVITQDVPDGDGDDRVIYVPLRFEVKEVDYTGTVKIDLVDPSGTTTGHRLSGDNVVFRQADDPTKTVSTTYNTTDGYQATLSAGKSYNVVVNGYTIPGVVVNSGNKTVTVKLYQVTLVNDTAAASSATLTATPTYLAAGQTGAVSASDSVTVGTDTYDFEKWVKDGDGTAYTTYHDFSYQMPAGAAKGVTFHASYTTRDAATVTITYEDNVTGEVVVVPGPTTVNVGSTGTVASGKPTRPGYDFVGWSTDQSATKANFDPTTNNQVGTGKRLDIAPGDTTPALNGDLTLYAIWAKQEPTWPDATLAGTTYGAHYGASVAITGGLNTAVTYAPKSGSVLPGGLTLNSDGTITGRPYEVGTKSFTVTATSASGLTWEKEFSITVEKAKPTLVNVSGTGAVTGEEYNTGDYSVDVLAPMLVTKGNGATTQDEWNDETAATADDLVVKGIKIGDSEADGGVLELDADTTEFTAGKNDVALTWTPGASAIQDANRSSWGDIYEPAQGTATVYTSGETYTMTVTPTAHEWKVKAGFDVANHDEGHDGTVDANNTAYGKSFTLTNTGNQATGALTYAFKSTGTDTSAVFALEPGYSAASLDPTETTTFYVKPIKPQAAGTYTDTLTITNAKNGTAVVYTLTLVVEKAATFDFEVDTILHDSTTFAGVPGDVTSVALRPTSGGSDITLTANSGSAGVYQFNDLSSATSYTVVVNGYATNVVIDDATVGGKVTIDLYQVILNQVPANTATLTLTKAGGAESGDTASYYYVEGQPFKASTTLPGGKNVTEWTEHFHAAGSAAASVSNSKGQLSSSRVMGDKPLTLTVCFEDLYEVVLDISAGGTMQYNGTQTYTDILQGGKVDGGKYYVAKDATFGLPVPHATPGPSQYNITWAGHTFRGWATSNSATEGAYTFTANAAADGDGDNVITLYPVWTADSNLDLPAGVIKGVYKHDLIDQKVTAATGGSGTYTSYTGTLPFGLTLDGTTRAVTGKPNDVGATPVTITVTDSNGDTDTADYSFIIDKADVKLKDGTAMPTDTSVTAGDTGVKNTIESKLNNTTTGVKMDGDGTGETDINGSWAVKDGYTLPTAPGTYEIPVVFTPTNSGTGDHPKDGDHYNPYETTVKLTIAAKLITAANIGVTIPAAGNTPDDKNSVVKTSLTPNAATFAADVEVVDIFWSPKPSGAGDTFIAGTPYTVTVVLKIKTGSEYRFNTATGADHFKGTVNGEAATVEISTTPETATFSYTFPAEDAKINAVNVKVDTLGTGTSNPAVSSAESYKYKVTDSKWYEKADVTGTTPITDFAADKEYDLVVTLQAQDGYVFNDSTDYFGGSNPAFQVDGKWIAMVNDKSDPSDPEAKTPSVVVKLDGDGKTITIRFKSFQPQEKTLQGVTVAGDLGIYYVNMGTNKHHDKDATGHKGGSTSTIDFTFSPNGLDVKAVYLAAGGSMTPAEALPASDYELWVGTPEAPGSVKIWDGTTGRTFVKDGTDDDRALDGKRVYLKTGNLITLVGQLTVKELWVKSMKDTDDVKPNLVYTVGDNFATAPAGAGATKPTVSFNTDTTALKNDVTLTGYGADDRSNNTPTNYFFALNADGTGELTDATKMTATHNGATVYLCYADVNDHVVSVPVGTLKIKSGDLSVTVADGNGHDPEYGDKLTATPDGGEGPYTYQWQVKDGSDWNDITGANGPDYVPTGDDIGDTIRVKITDSTGAEVIGDKIGGKDIVIKRRSLNFDVKAHDKPHDTTATNVWNYTENDFTLIIVEDTVNGNYGGVLLGDQVTLAPAGNWNDLPGANRPPYAGADKDDEITWPAVSEDGISGKNASKFTDYTLGNTNAAYYRLAPQGQQEHRGTIKDALVKSVSHVDVHFNEMPTFGHNIPGEPTGVTLTTETQPGEGGTDFKALWYDGTPTDMTNPGSKTIDTAFGAKTYTVIVQVKPMPGYEYDTSTEFYFHFGAGNTIKLPDGTNGGVEKDASGVYHMYYTFTAVARPKIAHVNVSVPQPVVYGTPTDGAVNQALGTDGAELKDNLDMSNITWKDSANNTPTSFIAGETYTAEFDLTTKNSYLYVNDTPVFVDFTVSGVGPIVGANTVTNANTVIQSVTTTTTNADTTYHVVVVYKTIQGGKVDLTDVYVKATVPDVTKTLTYDGAGKEPNVDSVKPYELTGTDNVWQFWNEGKVGTDKWDTITTTNATNALDASGNFRAGVDYRVKATVKLKTGVKYQITTGTKFYLAGIECTATEAAELHTTGDKTLKDNGDGTYTLIREFSIPANGVGLVTVTYVDPMAKKAPDTSPTYSITDQVSLTDTSWTKLTTQSAPAVAVDFTGTAIPGDGKFTDGTFYLAQSTVTPETGYALSADTRVNINGILVTADGTVGKKLDADNNAIGWALATYNSTGGTITVKYVAKTASVDREIISVETSVTAPSANGTVANATASVLHAFNIDGGELKSGVTVSNVQWFEKKDDGTYPSTPFVGSTFGEGKEYKASYTVTVNTAAGYSYRGAENFVDFTINGAATPLNVKNDAGKTTVTSADGKVTITKTSATVYTVTVEFDPTTADTVVTDVTVDYTVPANGAHPAVDKQYTQTSQVTLVHQVSTGANANTTGSTWHSGDKNGTVLDTSGTFGIGDHTVVAVFTANGGFVFNNSTKFIVNGASYTAGGGAAHVTLSNENKTATVWHTFPGLDKEIVKVITAVTKPVAGATPQNKASTTLAANKDNTNLLDAALTDGGDVTIAWTKTAGGAAGNAFEYSTAYTATFDLAVNTTGSYSYRGAGNYVDFLVNGSAALNVKNDATTPNKTVSGAVDGATVTLTRKDANTYTVKIDFPATRDNVQNVLEVHVDTILPPRYKNPIPTVAVRSNQPYEDVGATAKWQKWVDANSDGTVDPTEWQDVIAGETFVNGVKYRVTGQVHLKNDAATLRDYDVTTGTKFFIGSQEIAQNANNTAVTVNGVSARATFAADHTATGDKYDDTTVYTLTLEFDALVENKTIVDFGGNVLAPVVGDDSTGNDYKNVSKLFAHNQDGDDVLAHVQVGDATWKVSADGVTFGDMPTDKHFAKDAYYQASFDVEAINGYSLATDIKFLINGAMITGAGNAATPVKVTTTKNGSKYTITVTFPQTKDKADIFTVWGIVTEPKATVTASSDQIKVAEKETYRIVDGTNNWYTDAACTDANKFTGAFQPGKTYYAKLTVKIKDALSGKYQFTANTEGYINDTTNATTKTFNEAEGTITLTRAFTVPLVQTPVEVRSPVPTKGDPLPTAAQIVEGDANKYTFSNEAWSGDLEDGKVKAGTEYTLTVTVTPKDGYTLPANVGGYTWLENGAVAQTPITDNHNGSYTVTFKYKTAPEGVQPLDPIITVREPVKGASPSAPISPNDSVTIVGHTWTDASGHTVSTFTAGGTYTAEVKIASARPDGTGNYAADQTVKFNTFNETIYERDGELYVKHSWSLPADPVTPPPSGGGGTVTITEELPVVTYWLGEYGFTNDLTAEKVKKGSKPTQVPGVSGLNGYVFVGWSETEPPVPASGQSHTLVDPKTFTINADKTFYAVYTPGHDHLHYVVGYKDGTFKPDQYITRAEVATIVANSCLAGFDNDANYGNPGGYSDVKSNRWYANEIAYCTMYGVFTGYKDGTFRPDQYITRQELAVVVANIAGVQSNAGMPFTDASSINKWARDAVYTAYKNGWVTGYPDGSFRPKNNITRAETVTIFNGYLHRGVDKAGLATLKPYALNAASGGYEGDGSTEYMTWVDVPEKHWAYYQIIEASNDHDFHWPTKNETVPEAWDAAYLDETWRYRQEFQVTYDVGDHGDPAQGSVLTISIQINGKPKSKPIINAHEGYVFLGWSETPGGAVVDPLTLTITGPKTYYAVYEVRLPSYTVRYNAGTEGAVTGASSENVTQGHNPAHVPNVNAHEGYTFLGWSETPGGALVSPANLAVTGDRTYYAVYEAQKPQLQNHTAYMSGYADGTFRPSQAITRAEVVTMVVRALGTDYDPNHVYDTSSVTDVANHPDRNMIGYCIEKGIFTGYKDGTFKPEGTMTRQEFAVVIANLSGGAQENQGLPFTDASSVNKWARNAVYTVYKNGWITGYKDGSFQPKNNITRAEAAVIFNGFLGRKVDKTSLTDVPAGATSPWSDVKVKNWAYQNIMEAATDHAYYLEDGVEHWAQP